MDTIMSFRLSNKQMPCLTKIELEEKKFSIIVKGTSAQIEELENSIRELVTKMNFEKVSMGSWLLSERDLEVP
jgi:hypothetical protein